MPISISAFRGGRIQQPDDFLHKLHVYLLRSIDDVQIKIPPFAFSLLFGIMEVARLRLLLGAGLAVLRLTVAPVSRFLYDSQ